MVAEMLGIPQVSLVTKLEAIDEKTYLAHRQIEGGEEVIEFSTPALITTQRGLNEPRYPKLPDIMKAKKKELKTLGLSDIGLSFADVAHKVQLVSISLPPAKQAGKILTGGADSVPQLIRLLKEEAKVI